MRALRRVKCKSTVTVVKPYGERAVERRVMDMGITKGTEVYVRKVVPLEDLAEVDVRSYELSLGKADTGVVEVQ